MAERDQYPTDDDLLDLLAGRSTDAEAARMTETAEGDPELRAEIALMQAARDALTAETAETSPGEMGWARLSRAMDAEDKLAAQPPPAARPRAPVWLVAASVAVAAVALWQFVAVPLVPGLDSTQPGFVTATDPGAGGVVATIAFVPETTEAEIRALLRETGAEIVGGPSALGLWRLGFADAEARDAAMARLAAETAIVESVQAE